ncbi:methylenetetrahydrofolate reductase [NAD(P)H] [Altererythrobacter soli]|uniref:Methylenetetrahydrofolate reductase n=1 Tax=Croceibacterium soli TaxID=1739690 RepID=A0A6I4UVL6_9SPHN|nr:methylenetetrahydrofolate reductase [NAD(P)H] [Croceibacterium soli]MXP42606.1 methylenetetrahydrofolate reductase [NAD(P)H] [Croceibacterium soli]
MNAYGSLHFEEAGEPLFADLPGDIAVSFEFFPPKSPGAESQLWAAVEKLAPCGPAFVSMTYGAGGTTREGSLAAVRRLASETPLDVAAHLTCAGASKADVAGLAEEFWAAGVRHIVALRGDGGPPGSRFTPHPQGYRSAAELVRGLREIAPFEISVAAYPETHPDAASAEADLDNLKRKLDAGAVRALSQFFFSADTFLRFRDRAASAGIDAPIVPGILPVTNFGQTRKFAAACGAEVPGWMAQLFLGLDDHPEPRQLVAATVAAELCRRLYAEGVRDFHFYTLNRAELTQAICHLLGRRLPAQLEPVS